MRGRKKSTPEGYQDDRTRNWVMVAYPDSAPPDWREIIDALHTPWVESPLHDMDSDEQGELKKAHWHLLLLFAGKKSFAQVQAIADSINAARPEPCLSTRGTVRYFAHLDNPEKHQYDINGIVGHGGADLEDFLKSTTAEKHKLIGEILDHVIAEGVTHFVDLLAYAKQHRRHDWYPVICSNTIVIREIVKSNWQKLGGAGQHA